MKIAVVGCGSIGQRHIRNLISLGENNILVFDTNQRLAKTVAKKHGITHLDSLQFDNCDCTFVCTPPSTHVDISKKALAKKSHVFIEKPLSNSVNGVSSLKKLAEKNSLDVFVGYVFRFDLGLQKIKNILMKKSIGNIISFDAYEGWYLPNWRPWQDHTKSYTGSVALGGGIILDGSHELNYLQWFGGKIHQVFSYYTNIPSLKVKTEGLAEILLLFKSKAIGRIHLDFINPKYSRHCEIMGDKGSIRWSFEEKTIEIQKSSQSKFQRIKYGTDTNQMYVDEMRYVLDCMDGRKNDVINLESALQTLETSLAIKKSGKLNRPISI